MEQETNPAETKTETPAVEAPGAEDNLDELLNEFDQPETKTKVETPKEEPKIDPAKIEELDNFREAYVRRQTQSDLDDAVKVIQADNEGLNAFKPKVLRAALEAEAADDPRLAKAWAMRNEKPAEWQKVLNGVGKKLAKEFEVPDKKLTENRDAARAAVSGQSTATEGPSVAERNKMPDGDFLKYRKETYGV